MFRRDLQVIEQPPRLLDVERAQAVVVWNGNTEHVGNDVIGDDVRAKMPAALGATDHAAQLFFRDGERQIHVRGWPNFGRRLPDFWLNFGCIR